MIETVHFCFFRIRLVSVMRGNSFFIHATTANDLRLRTIFYPRVYPLHLFSYLNSWERASIFECSVLNKGAIFITSLVWRGPWLGIELGTSRTWSQHCFLNLNNKVMFKCVLLEYWFYSGNVHRQHFPRLECPVYYFSFLVSCSKSFIFQVYLRLWRECFINFSFKNPQHDQPFFLAVFYKTTILRTTYWEWPSLAQSSPVHRKRPHTSAMICLYTTI